MTAKRRAQIKKQRRQNAIINTLTVLSVAFLIWVGVSVLDVAGNDSRSANDADWNLFVVMENIHEEMNQNTGAC